MLAAVRGRTRGPIASFKRAYQQGLAREVQRRSRRCLSVGPEARDLRAMSNDASDGSSPAVLSLAGIREAADRISAHTQVTPVMTCGALNEMSGREVFFKCELFQKTGSFKARGACNAVLLTPPECPCVVTHSSGNHAQALAWAASVRGIPAQIVMPRSCMAVKVDAVRGYGASVTLCENSKSSRESTAADIVSKLPGSSLIHSSNDARVQCGIGTIGLELVSQVKDLTGGADLDAVIVTIGGGGLISGVTTAVKALCPNARIIGAQPEKAADAFKSKQSGTLCSPAEGEALPDTIADGLRTSLGTKAWPVVRDSVDEIVTVSEDDIRVWMRIMYERMKLVIEPSAAVGVAALMSPQVQAMPSEMRKVGVVLCGGNVDVTLLQDLLSVAGPSSG
ncbi:unnamed protein product [Ectocarpus sp. CCAP 1310/34]|nr:unnamed protein product [Ectocarpus sp. CCAP 1310/34]